MKAVRRIGCWTGLFLLVALGTLLFLFTSFRQERSTFSGRPIRGNVAILGGDVQITQDEYVRGNLLVVGNDLTLEGQIGGNLVLFGGDVDLTRSSRVGGNVSVIGGDAEIGEASVIDGNVAVVGGDVELTGHSRVDGNVRVVGGRIEQDPDAYVGGNSSWRIYTNSVTHPNLYSEAPAQLALADLPVPPDPPLPQVVNAVGPGEEVQAQVDLLREAAAEAAEVAEELAEDAAEAAEDAVEAAEELAEDAAEAAEELAEEAAEAALAQAKLQREAAQEAAAAARAKAASSRTPWFLVFLGKLVQAFLWTLLITSLVLLFKWLLPKQVAEITQTAEKETALSFATGAIAVMGSALLAAILTITICFALLALPLLALLALVLLCGWTVTCYWLGRRLDGLLAGQDKHSWSPLVSIGLSSLVITGVTAFSWVIFPCLGFIIALLIGSTGTGAVIVHAARGSGRLPGGRSADSPDAPESGGEEAVTDGGGASAATADSTKAKSPDLSGMDAEANRLQFDVPGLAEEESVTEEESHSPAPAVQASTDVAGAGSGSADEPDDLTRIVGIGLVFSSRLQAAGIYTFAQLAALDAEQIAEAIGCPASRVERERLPEQAREFAGPQ